MSHHHHYDDLPELDDDGLVVVELLQLRMMTLDVESESRSERRSRKLTVRDESADRLAAELASPPVAASSWRLEVADDLRSRSTVEKRGILAQAARSACGQIKGHESALCVLVAVATSSPWPGGLTWVPSARARALQDFASELDDADQGDVTAVEIELAKLLRSMKREQIPWGRVAAAGAAGIVLGTASMGLAAPAVGAALGGAMGLSGAAATSAGLAAIGGGSLASGGFGMAGGAAFLAGAGGLLGGGLGAGGMRVAGCPAHSLVQDVVRAELLTRLLYDQGQADDEALRRVVLAMEEKLAEVREKVVLLAERVQELEQEKRELREEIDRLRRNRDAASQEDGNQATLTDAEERLRENGRHRATHRTFQAELSLLIATLCAAIKRLSKRMSS